jgi:5'(3')-deoxyribonucleotidase
MYVLLDKDGVLCDFLGGVFRLFGRLDLSGADCLRWDQHLELLGVTPAEFWGRIEEAGHAFWANLEPFPWAFQLYEALVEQATVFICTSPARDPFCSSGKQAWIRRHFPEVFRANRVILTNRKWICAGPDRILVDDSLKNCEDFESLGRTRSPGQAVLFPQPWNQPHERGVPALKTWEDVVKQVITWRRA